MTSAAFHPLGLGQLIVKHWAAMRAATERTDGAAAEVPGQPAGEGTTTGVQPSVDPESAWRDPGAAAQIPAPRQGEDPPPHLTAPGGDTVQLPGSSQPFPGGQLYPPPLYPPLYPPPAAQPPPGRSRRTKAVAIAAVLGVLIAGSGVGYYLYERSQRTITGLAVDVPGSDPWGPSLVIGPPLSPTTPFGGSTSRVPAGTTDGLYFDTFGASGCDRPQLERLLTGDATLAAAWSAPLGIGAGQTSAYVTTLTPMRLRADTRVTTHGYSGGQAEAYPATLQAGTNVLVDDRGVPRVRCADAAPLTRPLQVVDPYYGGADWAGFDPSTSVEVRSDAQLREFALVDAAGQQPFRRPLGTTGPADVRQAPDTGRLSGGYVLFGNVQRVCQGILECAKVTEYGLLLQFTGCPERCSVSESTWAGAVGIAVKDGSWRAVGDLMEGRGPKCGASAVPYDFTLTLAPTASKVVDGVWTATALKADYTITSTGAGACLPATLGWTIVGNGF